MSIASKPPDTPSSELLPRELIFRSGSQSRTLEFPAAPAIPEARLISLLGRERGVFPRADGQEGAWLLCDCQDETLQVYRVLSSREVDCSQCDRPDAFLYCQCGMLSRDDAGDEHAACLLCGAPGSDRQHPCRQLPGRPSITLAKGAESCCFCGWPGEVRAKASKADPPKRGLGEEPAAPPKPSRKRGKRRALAARMPSSTPEPDPASAPATEEASRGPLRARWGSRADALVLLPFSVVAVGLFVFWLASSGTRGLSPDDPSPRPEPPAHRAQMHERWSSEEASPGDLLFVDFAPPDPPLIPSEARSGEEELRQLADRLNEALATGDLRAVEDVLALEPETLDRMRAVPHYADSLAMAREVVERVGALVEALEGSPELAAVEWSRLKGLAPSFATASPLAGRVQRTLEEHLLALEAGRDWDALEQALATIARHLPGLDLSLFRQRSELGIHRDVLNQAQWIRPRQPHLAIELLEASLPSAAHADEHARLLSAIRLELAERDAGAPTIELVEKASYREGEPLELVFEIRDDYQVSSVSVSYGTGSIKIFEPVEVTRQPGPSEDRWRAVIEPSQHAGQSIKVRVLARDPSGHEGGLDVSSGLLRRWVKAD